MESTIVAPATFLAESAIGVVRVSGKEAITIALRLLRRPDLSPWKPETISPRTTHRAYVVDQKGEVVDEVLFVTFKAPKSYTGEDMVEIYCHGNPRIVEETVGLFTQNGARIAEPGEFTRRAFLNGKMDLTQAEAVLELITSGPEKARQMALTKLKGGLKVQIDHLKEELLSLLSLLEASVDFSEEAPETFEPKKWKEILQNTANRLEELLSDFEKGHLIQNGASVSLVGRPNVGKSSLFNALLQEDRAIVTPVPGTTRDVVEGKTEVGGLSLTLLDTAGLRSPQDQVERIGVERTQNSLENSHLALLVLDASEPLKEEDLCAIATVKEKAPTFLVVLNKCDLPLAVEKVEVERRTTPAPIIEVSARTGAGIENLKNAIKQKLLGNGELEQVVLTNLRHKECVLRALEAVKRATESVDAGLTAEFVAPEISESLSALGEITGENVNPDVLDSIFSQFCIGK